MGWVDAAQAQRRRMSHDIGRREPPLSPRQPSGEDDGRTARVVDEEQPTVPRPLHQRLR